MLKAALGFLSPVRRAVGRRVELELDDADKVFFEKLVEALRLLRDEAEAFE